MYLIPQPKTARSQRRHLRGLGDGPGLPSLWDWVFNNPSQYSVSDMAAIANGTYVVRGTGQTINDLRAAGWADNEIYAMIQAGTPTPAATPPAATTPAASAANTAGAVLSTSWWQSTLDTIANMFTGQLTQAQRDAAIAQCQADVRAAGGTAADLALCGTNVNALVANQQKLGVIPNAPSFNVTTIAVLAFLGLGIVMAGN